MSAGQKTQDLGWMSAGILYCPAECLGHSINVNNWTRQGKLFLREAAWSGTIVSVDRAVPFILDVMGHQQLLQQLAGGEYSQGSQETHQRLRVSPAGLTHRVQAIVPGNLCHE